AARRLVEDAATWAGAGCVRGAAKRAGQTGQVEAGGSNRRAIELGRQRTNGGAVHHRRSRHVRHRRTVDLGARESARAHNRELLAGDGALGGNNRGCTRCRWVERKAARRGDAATEGACLRAAAERHLDRLLPANERRGEDAAAADDGVLRAVLRTSNYGLEDAAGAGRHRLAARAVTA